MKPYSLLILLIALAYVITETYHFGSHWTPSCDAEVICDGIAALIFAVGIGIHVYERRH